MTLLFLLVGIRNIICYLNSEKPDIKAIPFWLNYIFIPVIVGVVYICYIFLYRYFSYNILFDLAGFAFAFFSLILRMLNKGFHVDGISCVNDFICWKECKKAVISKRAIFVWYESKWKKFYFNGNPEEVEAYLRDFAGNMEIERQ